MASDGGDDGWATEPQDTRELTCECGLGPVSVLHTLRVARHPDPTTVTVARTHEATVEWTADGDLPAWLGAVATVCPAYDADRFGSEGGPPRPAGDGPGGAGADGRFRAAPVDATVRPSAGGLPGLSDPYHYWNTPLARLLADEGYPDDVTSLAVDLLEGPEAVWADSATAGIDPRTLPGDREEYARVGLEFTARERFRRPTGDPPGSSQDDGGVPWERAGDPVGPATDHLGPAVEATVAPAVRDVVPDGDLAGVVAAVETHLEATWQAFRHVEADGDPYRIPDAAVETATSAPDRE